MIIEELKNHMKNFGFEKGECKKGFIKKGSENHLAAYDFKFNDFILYSTQQPIALGYQRTDSEKEGDLIVYSARPNFAKIGETLNKSCCIAYKDELYIKPNYCKKCKLEK